MVTEVEKVEKVETVTALTCRDKSRISLSLLIRDTKIAPMMARDQLSTLSHHSLTIGLNVI
jgi:hypothetical protein